VYSLTKAYAIAGNTFTESVRQPVYAAIVGIAMALILVSPYITMFTLQQSKKLVTDMGLATVLLAGLLVAAFTASNVISQEIENRTVLTVISKAVGRMEFIFGKFLGVVGGIVVAIYLLSLTLILTVSGGYMEADVTEGISLAIVLSVFGCMFLAVCYGVYSNFFHDRPFASRAIGAVIPLLTICLVIVGHYDPHIPKDRWGAFGKGVDFQVVFACAMVLWAVLVLSSIAIAASTRLTVVVNIALCSGVFLLGLLSEYLFGNLGQGKGVAGVFYLIVPNLQAFWVSDYLSAGVQVPLRLVVYSGVYALFHVGVYLFLAMLLFQNRQLD
jgi:hypothetical protein